MLSEDVLVHPIRLRVVHALTGGRALTTSELSVLLPDISKATLYRHVGVLAEADILHVANERRVRGAVERTYRLTRDRPPVAADAIANASSDDHRRAFAIATTTLVAEFSSFLRRERDHPIGDLVGYQQMSLWLSPEELRRFIISLRELVRPIRNNEPQPDRGRYLFSPIFFPTEPARLLPPTMDDDANN